MGFVSRKKLNRDIRWKMLQESGYRERDIMLQSKFAVRSNKGRTISFYKKHNSYGNKYDKTKFDIATFDLKNDRWV